MLRSVTWRVGLITTSVMFVLPPTNATRPASAFVRLPDPPGRLIDIGGQEIHLDCTGRGSPTVVFENGAGDFSTTRDAIRTKSPVWSSSMQRTKTRGSTSAAEGHSGCVIGRRLQRMHAERLRDRATLGNLPLVVISRAAADPSDSLATEHAALQRDLVKLSHHARHVIAAHAGHNVPLEEPELVVDNVRTIVLDVRAR